MLTWLAVKTAMCSAWSSFIAWCKERWELLVGVVVGVLGVLAITRKDQDVSEIFEKKNDLDLSLSQAEADARIKEDEALQKNIEKYLGANDEAKAELEAKVLQLDEDQRAAIQVLLGSETPEDEIALRLREFLK